MAQETGAGAAAFKNPLTGLTKPQIKQLAQTVRRVTSVNEKMNLATKSLADARFMAKANLSARETAKAVAAARAAERGRAKAEADLQKIADKFKDNRPMKAAFAIYQSLEKVAAGGNPAARSLLDEVKADLAIALPVAAAVVGAKDPAAKEAALEELLNGIGAGRVAKKEERVGELTEQARGEVEDVRKRREPNEFLDRARATYPASLLARYSLRGNEVVDKRTDAVAFVDAGKELRAKGDAGRDIIDAMLETAESRGWAPIKVFGTQAFKAAVWMEAASRGMDITGYKPSAQELEAAGLNRQINGKENVIAGTAAKAAAGLSQLQGVAKAFQEATTARQQGRAAKQFPELANAFALVGTFEKAIARPGMSKQDSAGFVDQFKDMVTERLQQGKPLPVVTVADRELQKVNQVDLDQER